MNGPFCPSCGASVEGVRFCTSCGAPVEVPETDPYEYLFAEPRTAGPAAGPGAGPTTAPPAGPPTAPPSGPPTAPQQQAPYQPVPPYQQAPQQPPAPYPPTAQHQPVPPYQPAPYQPVQEDYPTNVRPPAPPVWAGQAPAPVGYPGYAAPRRRSFGWPWVVAAAVLFVAVVGVGLTMTLGGHHAHTASGSPATTPATTGGSSPGGAPSTPSSPSPQSSPSPSSKGGGGTTAHVAAQVRGLLATEVGDHRADNAAVGAMLSCTHVAQNRRTIAMFAGARKQLIQRLAAVPTSSSPQLNSVTQQLLSTWRSLLPVDQGYARWSRSVHGSRHACHAPAAPATSRASKLQRRALRNRWVALVRAHSEWGVRQIPQLMDSRHDGLAYLLL